MHNKARRDELQGLGGLFFSGECWGELEEAFVPVEGAGEAVASSPPLISGVAATSVLKAKPAIVPLDRLRRMVDFCRAFRPGASSVVL